MDGKNKGWPPPAPPGLAHDAAISDDNATFMVYTSPMSNEKTICTACACSVVYLPEKKLWAHQVTLRTLLRASLRWPYAEPTHDPVPA